jgi:hypothetical protein
VEAEVEQTVLRAQVITGLELDANGKGTVWTPRAGWSRGSA